MAAEKTFSRINAGKSMLFLGRLTRCAQHRLTKDAPTIVGKAIWTIVRRARQSRTATLAIL
jgi:hypothetical protein